jgi:hypothetical protein
LILKALNFKQFNNTLKFLGIFSKSFQL